ncbi:MAG: glycosyltransferase family 1 protein [Bacteroidales bacterium]|nr:MAG: glycosyltransferase family 1 protein [Bacteroidales bacterium]
MRIAVNTRFLIKNKLEGIGWFTYETLKRITRWHPEHEFIFLFDRAYDPEFIFASNIKPIVLRPQSRHPVLWYIWFEHSVRKYIERNDVDLFLSPDGYLSLKTSIPQVAVIHDINFYHFPNTLPLFARWYYNHFFPKFALKSNRLATVSLFSKNDIVKSYGINPDNIDVTYNGANELYSPLTSEEIENTRKLITDGKPYFIFVGAFNPRKNLIRLLQAYELFKKATRSDIKLVIVGDKMYGTSSMMRALKRMSFKNEVVFTGRLQVDRLRLVVGSALAMSYVSYYEGFGIPLLEAMNCDIPIVASHCTSIPEVVGDAAFYVDPFDVNSIADGLIRLCNDEELRNKLILNARKQRDKFSWDKSAQLLFDCIMKAMDK